MENVIYTCGICGEALGGIQIIEGAISSHTCLQTASIVGLTEDGRVYPNPNEDTAGENIDKKCEKWTDEETINLIATYKELEHRFSSPQMNNSQVWNEISEKMKKCGINKTGAKCSEKWRNLKKTYIKIKTHNDQTGNDRKTWVFWDDLHDIFFKNPAISPVCTISSTGTVRNRDINEPSTSNSSPETLSKSVTNLRTERIKRQQLKEAAKERRHQERMQQKQKMFSDFMLKFSKD